MRTEHEHGQGCAPADDETKAADAAPVAAAEEPEQDDAKAADASTDAAGGTRNGDVGDGDVPEPVEPSQGGGEGDVEAGADKKEVKAKKAKGETNGKLFGQLASQ